MPTAAPDALAVSVLVPTLDRRESVVALVRALLAQDVPGSEVVVVDDGSSDGTLEALRAVAAQDDRLVVLRQDHAGKRAAEALAAGRARGRVLLLLDDDVVPGPGLVAGHVRAHADREDLVVVGYMPTTVPQPVTGASFATVLYAREYEGRCAVYEQDPDDVLQHLWMGNVSITAAAYERAGLARQGAFGFRHEDRDTGLACRAAGMVGVFDRSLRGEHQHSRTVEQFLRDCRLEGAGRAALGERRPGDEEADVQEVAAGLPTPVAALVRGTRSDAVRLVVTPVLTAALRAATRLPDVRPALALAKVLRRIEHQHGMLHPHRASRRPRSTGSRAGRLGAVRERLRWWRLRETALVAASWSAMRLLPARRTAVVHGWPDSEGNAVEVVRALVRRYPGTVHWLLDDPRRAEELVPGAPPGAVVPLRVNTVDAFRALFRAEVVFFTHGLVTAVRPPRSRLVVNLWHGDGPKLSDDLPRCASTVAVAATRLWGGIKAEMFGLRPQDVAVVGNPRVDSVLERPAEQTRRRLGLPDDGSRVVLWLPTFRRGSDRRHVRFEDGTPLSRALDDRITVPDGVVLLVKPHPMDTDDYAGLGARVLLGADLDAAGVTLAQLLAAADALVSDASSAWVDDLVLDRPIGFFLPDLEGFGEARGYNVPDLRAVLPGPVLADPAAVSGFLADVRDGTARPPSAHADAMARIGFEAQLPVTEHLLAWLDEYQVARGARPLFGGPAAGSARTGG